MASIRRNAGVVSIPAIEFFDTATIKPALSKQLPTDASSLSSSIYVRLPCDQVAFMEDAYVEKGVSF